MQDLHISSRELLNILIQIKKTLENILEIEDSKYEALKDIEIYQLIILNDNEESFLKIFETLELQRQQIVETLSILIGFKPYDPISSFVAKLPKEYEKKISGICLEIKKISYRIDIATDRNRYILETNSDMITQILDYACGHIGDQYNHCGVSRNSLVDSLHMLDQLV